MEHVLVKTLAKMAASKITPIIPHIIVDDEPEGHGMMGPVMFQRRTEYLIRLLVRPSFARVSLYSTSQPKATKVAGVDLFISAKFLAWTEDALLSFSTTSLR